MSYTGSSLGGACDLTTTTGSAGALCCSTKLGAIITIFLSVAIDNSVLYLWIAHLGHLHLTKPSLRYCNSSLRSSSVAQTVMALWVSVPMTLYLSERL